MDRSTRANNKNYQLFLALRMGNRNKSYIDAHPTFRK